MPKIGLIREGKIPSDKRVPLTPKQAKEAKERFAIDLVVQSSDIRCFSDQDYKDQGLEIVDTLSDCDIILGVNCCAYSTI